ncbi:MAG TPA: hypothetical protein DCS07_06515 [Bdellovibrionales bacterium]|nr:hypothetical protein [Bdellovibrionales bacterium]
MPCDADVGSGRNHGEAIDVQCGQEGAPGISNRDRGIGDDRDTAFDVFIEDKILAREFAEGLCDIQDVGIRKVEIGDNFLTAFAGIIIDFDCRRVIC